MLNRLVFALRRLVLCFVWFALCCVIALSSVVLFFVGVFLVVIGRVACSCGVVRSGRAV